MWQKREMHTEFLYGNVKERDYLEKCRHRWKDNIKIDLK
jgi:hypothetical protein